MNHSVVYKWFALYFPDYAGDKVTSWYPNGNSSIRIKQKNGQEFIFTLIDKCDWTFETIGSFIKRTKGAKK